MPRVRIVREAQEPRSIEIEIARLRGLDLEALRARWQSVHGRQAPPHLALHLLFRILAYQLQADAMGDLDAQTLRVLRQIDQTPSKKAAVPLTQSFDQRNRELSPGTLLTREWSGQHHRVMVLERGFAWDGRSYKSLSEIAKAITGTKWNGPRFFGLRDRKQAEGLE